MTFKLENKTTEIPSGTNEPLSYGDLIILITNQEITSGMTIAEMRKRLDIHKAAESANGHVELTADQAELLKQCIDNHRWPTVSADIVAFADDIEKAMEKV